MKKNIQIPVYRRKSLQCLSANATRCGISQFPLNSPVDSQRTTAPLTAGNSGLTSRIKINTES